MGYLQSNYSARDLDDLDQKAIFGVFKDRYDYLFPGIETEKDRMQWDRDMYDIILEGIMDEDGMYGTESMMLCMVTCPALDEWTAFQQGNVDEKDRRKSRKLLKDFFAKNISRFFQNTIFEINSHGNCKPREWRKRKYQYLALQLYDGPPSGYCDLYDPFHSGLLAPFYVAGMLDVKEFLEKMDRKYHFLSIETE
ncbi:MAG: hypothetical protein IJ733_19855 [Lachnospiraceae bacterium]|nr:hypothetical protein [Lachnospiraceae bacterium]